MLISKREEAVVFLTELLCDEQQGFHAGPPLSIVYTLGFPFPQLNIHDTVLSKMLGAGGGVRWVPGKKHAAWFLPTEREVPNLGDSGSLQFPHNLKVKSSNFSNNSFLTIT